MLILIPLMLCIAIVLFLISGKSLVAEVEPEERAYMDPLPKFVKLVWPAVLFISFYVSSRLASDYLQRVHAKLQSSGATYLMTSDQFVALRIIASLIAATLCLAGMLILDMFSMNGLIMLALLGYYYPVIWLGEVRNARRKLILKALPVYLDFIMLCVESGLNFTGAITQTIEKGPAGPLRHELYLVIRDIRSGLARADALRRMDARVQMDEVTSLVSAVIQAEKMGSSLGSTLRIQSEQRRMERFQRAEKQAMEAPVKLMGPLVMFIFPLTFLVLAFPIVMMFLKSGAF